MALVAAAGLALPACGGGLGGSDGSTIALVGYAVPKAGHDTAQSAWAGTADGRGAGFKASYGPSGDQSRAVASGLDADLVHFSLEGDVTRLVDAGLVADSWDRGPTKGIVSESIVVLAVRKGNPKHIEDWDDLVEDGIGIVTPNPGSSGSARWNVLAAYGHVMADGGSATDAKAYLEQFFENVEALPGGGRDATTAFLGGTGDVLVSYESEAILARQKGADFDYVIPDVTLLIENPAAVLKDADPRAATYLHFLRSDVGQKAFASAGFRPLDPELEVGEVEGANDPGDPFPAPKTLLTIADDFGGWPSAVETFFDEDEGLVPAVQRATAKT